jgi:haloalkane dehalogenase
MPELWEAFHEVVETSPELHIGRLVAAGCVRGIDEAVVAAYDAPFPDESFKAGPRALPDLVPRCPDDPAAPANRRACRPDLLSRSPTPACRSTPRRQQHREGWGCTHLDGRPDAGGRWS